MNISTNSTNVRTICYNLSPNDPQANLGFDVWMWLAYIFLFLSYLNVNILYFRLTLILAAVWFIVWGLEVERSIQMDTLMFNIAFIVINIIMSIPLIKQVWPVKLSKFEHEIYERDFCQQMNIRQFKYFMSFFVPDYYGHHRKKIVDIGENFEYMIYIAKIYPGWKVYLKGPNDIMVKELSEGAWIGTIEFSIYDETKNLTKQMKKDEGVKWAISSSVEETFIDDEDRPVQHIHQHFQYGVIQECGVIAYHISLKVNYMDEIFIKFLYFFRN
jgi:hypothetical protein